MTEPPDEKYLARLVRELCRLPAETQWAEFKENYSDPDMIGELVSALSNSAALEGKVAAYIVWGVVDRSHEVVGQDSGRQVRRRGTRNLRAGWSR